MLKPFKLILLTLAQYAKLAPIHAKEVNEGIGHNKHNNNYMVFKFYQIWAIKDKQISNRVAKWTVAPVYIIVGYRVTMPKAHNTVCKKPEEGLTRLYSHVCALFG